MHTIQKGTDLRIMLSEYLTLTGALEDVVEPPIVHVIQYPTHQMVLHTHMCVERLSHINEEI